MTPDYSNGDRSAAFFESVVDEFAQLVDRAGSVEWRELAHDEVEERIEEQGREVLRKLLEAHMAIRGTGKAVGMVLGSDTVERSHERKSSRQLGTVLGTVVVPRTGYSAHGAGSLFVADAELNLPADKHSLVVRRRAAELASQISFELTTEWLQEQTGATAGKRQVEELVQRAATDFEEFYRTTALATTPEKTGDILTLTFDMKGIVMRKQDLRPKTQEAAARDVSKPALDKTQTGRRLHRKRMAMVASVYTVPAWIRTPEEVCEVLNRVRRDYETAGPRPKNEHKRVWASITRLPRRVIHEAFEEALSRDPHQEKRWFVLVDGDLKQLKWVKSAARQHGVKVTIVLDIIHVLQYLWRAGKAFYPDAVQRDALEAWVQKQLLRVLKGDAGLVAGGMRRSATMRKLSTIERMPIDKCSNYLKKYKKHLRYDDGLADGAPISTGVIEGACRHLIADRLDITGARWSLEGAEAVLKIRSLRSSGDMDDYWDFHREREYERNHGSRYFGGKHPPIMYHTTNEHLRYAA